jgi:two-component system, chemotaxis family, CheB/CheR fusion protein
MEVGEREFTHALVLSEIFMIGKKRGRTKTTDTGRLAKPATASGKSPKTDNVYEAAGKIGDGFPIVGIGASAGGLESLEQFFGAMPKDSGMAFVVIQHLAPDHVGIMPELLQRITPMRVSQATDGVKLKPNCVYVIPPNKSMSLLKNALHLFDPVEPRGLRLPIDIFLRSLANDREGKSIGIILSGMGSDGSLGLKAIKEKNGTVLVQDPASAKFDGMPRSAIDAVIADIVAPAELLPSKLVAYLKYAPAVRPDSQIGTQNKSALDKIIILLREQTGHDFALYKKTTLMRRIERRKGIHQIGTLQTYVRYLQDNPKETEILFKELLIGVTGFFRDPELWQKLRDKVLPEVMEKLPNGYVLRAWVTGCSTGEEAYSLAIVFQEALERFKRRKQLTLQIFASDLDKDAIARARKGVFTANISADVSPERISRFFTVDAEGCRVVSAIREMVVFAPQNVIKDPPFTKLDLLTCRNMLIYMEPELQEKLVSLFHYSLNSAGILILGTAETLGNQKKGFNELDAKLRIYQRTAPPMAARLNDFPGLSLHKNIRPAEKKISAKTVDNIQALADQLLLNKYTPASVLMNEKGDILYLTGSIGKYLEPVAGKANFNIYAMAREGLRQVLPSSFRQARQTFDPVHVRNLKVESSGVTHMTDMTIQRIEKPDAIRGLVMAVFSEVHVILQRERLQGKKNKGGATAREKQLEIELQRCYEDLHNTTEEMQTAQEELHSINEELQSTNEELQSSNEELTTSKEEMQSLNEELQTVNIELQSKVSDYMRANDDLKNLLNSTEIATLFLDKELNIRRFTEQVARVIKLRKGDIGRPLADLVTDFIYPEIDEQARQVMKTLTPVEKAIATRDDRWFSIRILPYRTIDDHIDGLVITFMDITIAKKLELELQKANDTLRKNG